MFATHPHLNAAHPTTRYAFDVDPATHAFKNRRVFAYVDAGIPDGIQLDTNGNVYSGAGDGVHVRYASPCSRRQTRN